MEANTGHTQALKSGHGADPPSSPPEFKILSQGLRGGEATLPRPLSPLSSVHSMYP